MPRLCEGGFLKTYLKYTKPQESPEMFHLWSAISIISAALGRKCFMDRGFFKCYPNQYIVLVTESARCRKTTAADIAIDLYRKADIGKVLKGKITARALSSTLHDANEETGTSTAFIYSSELGKFLGPDSYQTGLMVSITDLYDCPDVDDHVTQTQGEDHLENVFVNMLGCTVPNWLSSMPSDMVEGGLSSRTIFVVQHTPRAPNPNPKMTKEMLIFKAELISDLKQISQISGEFTATETALLFYEEWYVREYARVDKADVRLRAYFARKGEHVWKICMVLSAVRSNGRRINQYDFEEALKYLEDVERYMPTAFRGVGLSESTKHLDKIVYTIEQNGGKINHSVLLKKLYYHMDKDVLWKILSTLREANVVRLDTGTGKKIWYLL